MSSSTNSLEATHRHLSEAISRRNPFWASLALLFEAIADKTIHFETAAVYNFRTSLKRSKKRSQSVSKRRMAEECAFLGPQLRSVPARRLCMSRSPIRLTSLAATDTQ
jgi:hypothetical protein